MEGNNMKGKKLLLLLAAALIMTSTLVMSTFASYDKTITKDGSAEAKDFYLEVGASENTFIDVKIAPEETFTWDFTVSNQTQTGATEVDMDVDLTLVVGDYDTIPAIPVLTITLYEVVNGVDTLVGELDATDGGVGTIAQSYTLDANIGVTKSYKVIVAWNETANDIDYMNNKTALNLTVTGSQVVA
jgi:hypothetical protein